MASVVTDGDPSGSRPEPPRMANRVTLRFGEFGQRSLKAESGRLGTSLDELLSRAVACFDARLRVSPGAPPAPRFKPSGWGIPRALDERSLRCGLGPPSPAIKWSASLGVAAPATDQIRLA